MLITDERRAGIETMRDRIIADLRERRVSPDVTEEQHTLLLQIEAGVTAAATDLTWPLRLPEDEPADGA